MRAIFPGRFQPLHMGHIYAIQSILKENDSLLIIIENANESFTFKNPLTAGERFEMIIDALKDLGLTSKEILVMPMEIIKNNAEWINHLKVMAPKFDVCYSNNELVKILMENANIKVRGISFIERDKYQGSEIRRRIAEDLPWKNLVPENVYNYIINNHIDDRVKKLYGMKE